MMLIIAWAGKASQVFAAIALLAREKGDISLGDIVNASSAD